MASQREQRSQVSMQAGRMMNAGLSKAAIISKLTRRYDEWTVIDTVTELFRRTPQNPVDRTPSERRKMWNRLMELDRQLAYVERGWQEMPAAKKSRLERERDDLNRQLEGPMMVRWNPALTAEQSDQIEQLAELMMASGASDRQITVVVRRLRASFGPETVDEMAGSLPIEQRRQVEELQTLMKRAKASDRQIATAVRGLTQSFRKVRANADGELTPAQVEQVKARIAELESDMERRMRVEERNSHPKDVERVRKRLQDRIDELYSHLGRGRRKVSARRSSKGRKRGPDGRFLTRQNADPYANPCAHCGAPAGRQCVTKSWEARPNPHAKRMHRAYGR